MQRTGRLVLAAGLLVIAASPAWAIRESDPPWVTNPSDPQWQGGATTSQGWEFSVDLINPAYVNNPYGDPFLEVPDGQPETVPGPMAPPFNGQPIQTWHINPGDGGPGLVNIGIPNNPLPNSRKVIWLQFTSDRGLTGSGVTTDPEFSTISPGPVIQYPPSPGNPDAWYTYTFQIEIMPNPESELITLEFPTSTNIEEVHVDTICVPEPISLALFALSACWIGRRPNRAR